jgi:asparagine synthase (glutamine-hydrolysing)
MCGIAGILSTNGGCVDRGQLTEMIATLGHRGPDAQGIYAAHGIGLAHARLSILDPEGGSQPMSTHNGKIWITFNGEIFNHIELRDELLRQGHEFTTRSDTEVILHLYQEEGESCVSRLNGQWAFAIWDAPRRKLFLSRDRMGVKPLFYTQISGNFLFASEIKALLANRDVHAALDVYALDQIFTFWVTLPPRTIFKNIKQIPPGYSLVLEDGGMRIRPHWRLEYPQKDDGTQERDEKRLCEELRALMADATRIRLRSDVAVGSYLSGGLDSTYVTALAKQFVNDKLRTFSIGFDDPAFDESRYQHEASQFLNTHHTELRCNSADITRILPDVIRHAEQPIFRAAPAPLYLLAKLVRDAGVKVVLTGEGADEIMGGYDIFKEAKIRRFWGRNPDSRWRPLLLKRLYPYLEAIQRQPVAYLKTFFSVSPENLANPFFSHLQRWQATAALKLFFSEEVREQIGTYSAMGELSESLPTAYHSWSAFNQSEYLEAMYLLPGYILSSQSDRMAMANSVEARHPFLDYRVIEFAAKLAPTFKMKVLKEKYLLKKAASGLIPRGIECRFKQPYRAPGIKNYDAMQGYCNDVLSKESVDRHGVFDSTAVTAMVAKVEAGRANSARDEMAIMGVLSTQILLEQFSNRKVRKPSDRQTVVREFE